MTSVTGRIKEIKQPRGGYIKPSQFKITEFDDGIVLNENENIHAFIIGMVVDYLTRFITGTDKKEAFEISLKGALCAERMGKKGSLEIAVNFLSNINGVDDNSIINACKLVTFDAWFRNPMSAMMAKDYQDINPDEVTIKNIQVLINRSLNFFNKYGKIIKDGFTFEPVEKDDEAYKKMIETRKGTYGGYTATVISGDGDFLTADTLWDFKVSKSNPTNRHTLQLLMYWIMGQHSGQEIYKKITKLGIFNPRLNTVYLLDVKDISDEIIKAVENEVICYE